MSLQETYELALLGLGGVVTVAGLAGMLLLYCRTVHVGFYSEERMQISVEEVMKLFPRVCVVCACVRACVRVDAFPY